MNIPVYIIIENRPSYVRLNMCSTIEYRGFGLYNMIKDVKMCSILAII